ncbi:hypothetical protein KPH14_013026, partial [Odynerus spinipes]
MARMRDKFCSFNYGLITNLIRTVFGYSVYVFVWKLLILSDLVYLTSIADNLNLNIPRVHLTRINKCKQILKGYSQNEHVNCIPNGNTFKNSDSYTRNEPLSNNETDNVIVINGNDISFNIDFNENEANNFVNSYHDYLCESLDPFTIENASITNTQVEKLLTNNLG